MTLITKKTNNKNNKYIAVSSNLINQLLRIIQNLTEIFNVLSTCAYITSVSGFTEVVVVCIYILGNLFYPIHFHIDKIFYIQDHTEEECNDGLKKDQYIIDSISFLINYVTSNNNEDEIVLIRHPRFYHSLQITSNRRVRNQHSLDVSGSLAYVFKNNFEKSQVS